MEIQSQILLFFSGLHTGFLNAVAQFFTLFGEELIPLAIAMFIIWAVDKKKGFMVSMSILCALNAMGIIKAIVRYPRPWLVIEGLDVVRQHTATGYSFPSGHTTTASSFLSSVAVSFRKRWISITCAVLILLVCLSRIYLCVHWPMDVAGGLLIGCGATFLLSSVFSRLYDDKPKCIKALAIMGAICTVASVVMSILLVLDKVDATAFSDLNISVAMTAGICFSIALERAKFDYKVEQGSWGKKIIRLVIGIAVTVLILFSTKPLFNALGIYNEATRALRYMLTGFWVGAYPLVVKKTGLFVA